MYHLNANCIQKPIVLMIYLQRALYPVQCNLNLVTLLVSAKTVTKFHNVTKLNDLRSKLKNGSH